MTREQRPDDGKTPPSPGEPQWGAFVSLGISTAVILGVFVVGGILLDGALHTSPIFLFVGVVLGGICAGLSAFGQVKRFMG